MSWLKSSLSFVLQQSHHVKLGMSGSLNRFTAAAEFQTRHPLTFANAHKHLIVPGWESLEFLFLDVFKLVHRKKAQRTLGFLTNSGLKLHTCLWLKVFSSFSGVTAIHRKVSEELKKQNKTKHKPAKKAYSLKVQFISEYRQTRDTAQSSFARKLLGTAVFWRVCAYFPLVFTCKTGLSLTFK